MLNLGVSRDSKGAELSSQISRDPSPSVQSWHSHPGQAPFGGAAGPWRSFPAAAGTGDLGSLCGMGTMPRQPHHKGEAQAGLLPNFFFFFPVATQHI